MGVETPWHLSRFFPAHKLNDVPPTPLATLETAQLTSEGMTLIGTKVIKVIEEFLPSKFGGDSTDYQLLEEEDEKGLTRLNILVSPNVGNIDEKDLLSMVLRECSNLVGEVWSQAGSLQVKRVHPIPTKRGKIMPFHALK